MPTMIGLGGGATGLSISGLVKPTEALYTNPGTYNWECPAGVTSVSVVVVGSGGKGSDAGSGGGGGALAYKNNITVVPGNTYAVKVGDGAGGADKDSSFVATHGTTMAYGGGNGAYNSAGGTGGTPDGQYDGGGNGGDGGAAANYSPSGNIFHAGGGGGAGNPSSGAGGSGIVIIRYKFQ